MAGSASSLLRAPRRYVPPVAFAPEDAVDDFAFLRAPCYGTFIVDRATRKPIELLRKHSQGALIV